MNGKALRNVLIVYLVILLVVIITQIPKNDLEADEPIYKVEIDDDNLEDAIIMNVDSPVVFVGNEQKIIESKDVDVVPKLINGSTYVPIQVFKNIFQANVTWDSKRKETTVRYNNRAVIFTNGSRDVRVIDSDTDKIERAVSEPVIVRERMYVPLRLSLEAFDKHIFYKDGLIVITDFDVVLADEVIADLIKKTARLPVVGSEENLEILLGKPTRDIVYYLPDDAVFNDVAAEPAGETADDFTRTNVQVEGVDEGDIIKTDGEYIYYVNNRNIVHIVKAFPPEEMNKISEINQTEKEAGEISEIYINGDKLVVVGNTNININAFEKEENVEETTENVQEDIIYEEPYYMEYCNATYANIYDISDKTKPVLEKQVKINGTCISSRITDNCLYIVSDTDINMLVCDDKYVCPVFYDSTVYNEPQNIEFSDICYIPEKTSKSYMTVAGVDLRDINKEASVYTTIASGEDIYMSNENLYVASGRNETEIYKFKLNKGNVMYSAHGKVSGRIHNQFSMDENNGYFRITTTENKHGKTNNLFILDDKLDKVSEITGIAPNEDIHSTRFMGNRAYMVTFETVDPLFVIDVANPEKPEILGELKIPGYSDYLHPYDENHLIGIGKDTFVYNDMAYYKGIKLSMFDITDLENPVEMFNEIIGDRGTNSNVLTNHKALIFDKEKNILGFPINICTVENKTEHEEPTEEDLQYGTMDFQGFVRYSIDMNDGFRLESKTTHFSSKELNRTNFYKSIKRGLIIGNYLYTVSDAMIMAEDLETEKTIGKVEFY